MIYNEDYGKINPESGNIEYAPANAKYENKWYIPCPGEYLVKLGYKAVVDTPYPTDGHEYLMEWSETPTSIVKVWRRLPDPAPLTPSQQREIAYQTEPVCMYGNGVYTVDYMNKLWYEYSAEGDDEKVSTIQASIVEGKQIIRERYPDI